MASNCGPFGISTGIGTKTINIGMTAIWMQIDIRGPGLKPMKGIMYGGDQYCYSNDTVATAYNKAIRVENTSGTVVLEGTWTSFTGNNVVFNITTNTLGSSQSTLAAFGN